jgi:2-oxoglutarate ferredoxin oxidoreductase subunit beta
MTYLAKPKLHHPSLAKNRVGYTRRDYEGRISTLCAGCGHDSISAAIIQACWELDIEPHRVAKLSGIGCSSKTPDYFLGNSHGFNTVHGRMPSVLTGAYLANRELIYLGVSGDGDSASIGLGQFAHVMRRGVNMTYWSRTTASTDSPRVSSRPPPTRARSPRRGRPTTTRRSTW